MNLPDPKKHQNFLIVFCKNFHLKLTASIWLRTLNPPRLAQTDTSYTVYWFSLLFDLLYFGQTSVPNLSGIYQFNVKTPDIKSFSSIYIPNQGFQLLTISQPGPYRTPSWIRLEPVLFFDSYLRLNNLWGWVCSFYCQCPKGFSLPSQIEQDGLKCLKVKLNKTNNKADPAVLAWVVRASTFLIQ